MNGVLNDGEDLAALFLCHSPQLGLNRLRKLDRHFSRIPARRLARQQEPPVDRIPPAERLTVPPDSHLQEGGVDEIATALGQIPPTVAPPIRFSSKHAPKPMFTSTAPSLISRAATSALGTNRASGDRARRNKRDGSPKIRGDPTSRV